MKILFTFLIWMVLIVNNGFSQHIGLSAISSPASKKLTLNDKYGAVLKNSDSEYKLALNGAFLFYKELLSSQDGSNCNFTPSCSEYAVLAVKKHGALVGGAMFFDRYTRCNSMNREYYKKDNVKQRLIDPIE